VEVPIDSPEQALSLGSAMLEQLGRVFEGSEGWQPELPRPVKRPAGTAALEGFQVESRPLSGPLGNSGLRLFRGRCVLAGDPGAFYNFLVSPEGYRVIDPDSDPSDLGKAIEVFDFRDPNITLQVEVFKLRLPIPLLRPRSGVVLNLKDARSKSFLSTSILHKALPGGSRYQDREPLDGGRGSGVVRMTTASGLQLVALPEQPKRFELRNFLLIDLGGMIGSAKVNNKAALASFEAKFLRLADKARELH